MNLPSTALRLTLEEQGRLVFIQTGLCSVLNFKHTNYFRLENQFVIADVVEKRHIIFPVFILYFFPAKRACLKMRCMNYLTVV